jgi:general stress protein YciG
MSGTREGGIVARNKIIKNHGPDFWSKIGKLGGQKGTGHKFAHGRISPSDAGKLGGRKPRKQTVAQKPE